MFGAWLGREYSPGSAQERILEGRPGTDQFLRDAGQVLRMNVNRRLTATPRYEDVLVTNSVCAILLEGVGKQPEASGNPLDNFANGTSFGLRTTRAVRRARSCERNHRKSGPVSATQFLFVSQGAAPGV